MKKTKLTVIIGVILAMAVINVAAQSETGSAKDRAIAFAQEMKDAGNLAVTLSPCYAPDVKDKAGNASQWGVSLAATYTFQDGLGKFLFTGMRLDYLGNELWAPSVNGGLRADVQIFGHTITPVAYTGVVFPLSSLQDQVGSVGFIAGTGFKAELWHGTLFKKEASLFAGFAAEKWAMQDDTRFSGVIYRGFVGLKVRF